MVCIEMERQDVLRSRQHHHRRNGQADRWTVRQQDRQTPQYPAAEINEQGSSRDGMVEGSRGKKVKCGGRVLRKRSKGKKLGVRDGQEQEGGTEIIWKGEGE